MFITDLANDSFVSTREAQISARHNNPSSTTNYMTRDGLSETNKYVALEMVQSVMVDTTPTAEAAVPSSVKEDITRGEFYFFFS